MLSNIRHVLRPTTVDEALQQLRDGGGAIRPMAGGTAPARFRSRQVEGVVDLWSLPLRYVSVINDHLCIGATATLSDLVRSETVRAWAGGALHAAAGKAGSTPLRSMITAGGNLAGLYPWSDLPPVLLVSDAKVRIAGPAGPELSVDRLVSEHPSRLLGYESLLTEIVIPPCRPAAVAAFFKMGESEVDYSWLDVAVLVEMDGGLCRRCRVAIGAIETRCRRLTEVEELVTGSELEDDTAVNAGRLAAELVKPVADPRSSQEYRRELLETWCRRLLLQARDRSLAGGGE